MPHFPIEYYVEKPIKLSTIQYDGIGMSPLQRTTKKMNNLL